MFPFVCFLSILARMNITPHAAESEVYVDCKRFQDRTGLSGRFYWQKIQEGIFTPYRPSKRRTLVRWSEVQRWIEASRGDAMVAEVGTGEHTNR